MYKKGTDVPYMPRKCEEGVEVQLHSVSTSVPDGCEWSVLHSCHFTVSEKCEHWVELDWTCLEMRKSLIGIKSLVHPAHSLATIPNTLPHS